MSTTTQLRAYITIDTTVMAKGSEELANLRAMLRGLKDEEAGILDVKTRLTDATKEQSISTRSLLLNFRMFSFAVRTLRRELGITHPLFEQFSRVMLVGAAAGTLLVSANTLITKGLPLLVGEVGKGMSVMGGLTAAFEAGNVAVLGLSVAVGALIGFGLGTWIGEQLSPIREMNSAIKSYKELIEDLTDAIGDLKVEQSALSAESSMYAAAIARVNYEIALQGYATDAQTETLKMLEQATSRATVAQADLRAVTSYATSEAMRAADEQSAMEAEKVEARQRASRVGSPYRREPAEGLGRFNPFDAATRDMLARQITGLPVEVIVDFTGALFGNAGDITGAVRRGIDQGFQDVGRILEQLRRGK